MNSNQLGLDGGKALADGLKGNNVITELNIADNNLAYYGQDVSGIITLADVIKDMGALSVLSLKSNALLTKEAGKILGDMLKGNTVLTELDLSDSGSGLKSWDKDGPGFAQALAVGLIDNGAMTSLNLASNKLGAEGAKIVAEAVKVTMCTSAIILTPFSCPSDFLINCCCLLLSAGYGGTSISKSCE
jgi:hypothetical protein